MIIFSLLTTGVYVLVLLFAPVSELNTYINIVGQVTALVFAIFVGYFAFLQVIENRIDKLQDEGYTHFKAKDYSRATKIYEQVFSINTKNFSALSNLLELYLCQRDFEKVKSKLNFLEKSTLDQRDHLVVFYIKIASFILQEYPAEAKTVIIKLIDFKKNNRSLVINWQFNDIKQSPAYTSIEENFQKLFNNVTLYLQNGFSPEDLDKFEAGNYYLAGMTV